MAPGVGRELILKRLHDVKVALRVSHEERKQRERELRALRAHDEELQATSAQAAPAGDLDACHPKGHVRRLWSARHQVWMTPREGAADAIFADRAAKGIDGRQVNRLLHSFKAPLLESEAVFALRQGRAYSAVLGLAGRDDRQFCPPPSRGRPPARPGGIFG